MAKKKSFKAGIAEQFLTDTEESTPVGATDATTDEPQAAQKVPATTPVRQGKAQGVLFDVPMKPDYHYVETKSKRLNLLVQPRVYAKIKGAADRRGESVNELIHSLLEAFEE